MTEKLYNIREFQFQAREELPEDVYGYLDGGAEDLRTLKRNRDIFQHFQIRPRQLVDVSTVDTSVTFFGRTYAGPICLAPVGMLQMFHPEADLAAARAADGHRHLFIASTLSSFPYQAIREAVTTPPWFQLYPTSDRAVTSMLLRNAENNGCEVLVLTTDTPVQGNRESPLGASLTNLRSKFRQANFEAGQTVDFDPRLTWEFIAWLKANCRMKIVLKGILTAEDAQLALQHGADGIIVSNHGGRQLESDLSTLECLEEIAHVIDSRIPVLIDGGITRGTDVFKCLALGADAVCLGRAYVYGLAVGGQAGVEATLKILQSELVRDMQLAGTPSLADITGSFIQKKTL
jgi:isopentenyl diphosphate isomerase/L-lactate dehydrogenase-like FMN-dependent dehydrogenase